ncbi:MAG: response regulator transcription factor [Ignavibacteriae bacterium]|nr:response regulator transcription factor [Ignavibacteriota bacterium]
MKYSDPWEPILMTLATDSHEGNQARDAGTSVDESKKTILIYSPDLNFCFSLSMLFQDRYNVITTTNPGMLSKFVADYSADLVIVDAVPSEKMIERLSGLRGLNKLLPIIMLYVYSAKDVYLDQKIRAQVDSVFYKPFDLGAVSKRIEELLS